MEVIFNCLQVNGPITVITDTDIYFLQLRLKKMFVAVDCREHVNVTKKRRVPFALASMDLEVATCFAVLFYLSLSLCIQVSLWLQYFHQLIKYLFVSKR